MPVRLVSINDLGSYNTSALFADMERAIERELKQQKTIFEGYTASWSAKKQPKWKIKAETKVTKIIGQIGTRSLPFCFVEVGTSVRYATMTEDFIPKSAPGRLRSRAGRGGLLYRSRAKPRKGIEARDIRVLIAEIRQPEFTRAMFEVIRRNARR